MNEINIYLLAISIGSLLYVYWYFQCMYKYWKNRNVPDITPIVPFGNFLNILIGKWTIGQAFGECYLDFKKRQLKHGGVFAVHRPVYIPVDSTIIKHIMITDSDNFPSRGFYINERADPLTGNLFNMEGNKWRELRLKLPKVFTTARMRQMFVMMLDLSEELQGHLNMCMQKYPNGINIRDEMSKFTTDVTSRCVLGFESNIMKDKNGELVKHARSFFDYQFHIFKNTMVLNISKHILNMINFKLFKNETTKFVLDMFGELNKYRRDGIIRRDDFVNTLLALTEISEEKNRFGGVHGTEPLNDTQCIANMWSFLCAGFETSSGTIAFALYELAKNPKCQQKVRDDINSVLDKHGNHITYDSVMEMKYLDNVIDGK